MFMTHILKFPMGQTGETLILGNAQTNCLLTPASLQVTVCFSVASLRSRCLFRKRFGLEAAGEEGAKNYRGLGFVWTLGVLVQATLMRERWGESQGGNC